MEKKIENDLERMNKDRRKAEEEYLDSQQAMLEVKRIQRDGITNVVELVLYIADVLGSVTHAEDMARVQNNSIVYSEAIGIRREMEKLLDLVLKDGTAILDEEVDGTEKHHREGNDGNESYA